MSEIDEQIRRDFAVTKKTIYMNNGAVAPTPLSTMHLYPVNGAAGRVGKHDTAWSYRDALFAEVIVGVAGAAPAGGGFPRGRFF